MGVHLWKTIAQQTDVSEIKRFKMSLQEQTFSPSYITFSFILVGSLFSNKDNDDKTDKS